ncbi:hypothetical protein [Gracilibacillus sp. YIM 98692]|uniref:hypothetical protein n=1 Tax=Gracilibacillus sp. YIM 98692 TaxID=2663532 RepID=UPI0013D5A2B4|nr:hypothetical protein [Gracilibacillus sp. YIM 98692]
MKQLDWTMILFVSSTLVYEYWLLSGLPRIYFWNVKKQHLNNLNKDDDDRSIA